MVYVIALPRYRPCGQCTLMHMGLCPPPSTSPFFHAPLTHTHRELQGNARVSATAKGLEKMREGERQRTEKDLRLYVFHELLLLLLLIDGKLLYYATTKWAMHARVCVGM